VDKSVPRIDDTHEGFETAGSPPQRLREKEEYDRPS
jgi:hypothetical protein